MKKNTFVFDLDGTLLDTIKDLQHSLNYAIKKYGYEEKTYDEVRTFVGNGIARLIELSIPNGRKNEHFDEIYEAFFEYYNNHLSDYTKVYPNIINMLCELKKNNCKIAIVSNKSNKFVKKLSNEFFKDYIDIAVGENESIRRKPYPDMVDSVIEYLKEDKKNAVYIGDSEVDILTAQNSSLDCILVSWGFRQKDYLIQNGAKIIVDDALEILDYMEVSNDKK